MEELKLAKKALGLSEERSTSKAVSTSVNALQQEGCFGCKYDIKYLHLINVV